MKHPKKTKQEHLDHDVMDKKRKDYFHTGHGVGNNTPGGESSNSVSDRIGRPSIMGQLPDHNKDGSVG